jgi:hypothetical protein
MPITTTPSGGPQGEFSTYTPIYAQTLSSATSSITFSNIPTTFTDLFIAINTGTSSIGQSVGMQFNSDSGSNYSSTEMWGNGSTTSSARLTNATFIRAVGRGIGTDTTLIDTGFVNIQNYSNTTTNKTILIRSGVSGGTIASVGLWRNTSPITSVTFFGEGPSNIIQGSTFTLYGIKAAATPPKATGGDVVTTDGTYWYHAFKNSGVFDVKQALTADYLIVAGGGAGGGQIGGGGGAGGLRYFANQSFTSGTTHAAVVGAGGAGINAATTEPNSGTNSSFLGNSATGGGAGGGNGGNFAGGKNGGSSGGAGEFSASFSGNAGGYTPVEGYSGGNAQQTANYGSGGGGGAGGNGANGTTSAGGNGGIGVNTYSAFATATNTGVSGYYAGGGGGSIISSTQGSGGSGGGGRGGSFENIVQPQSGTQNTGGGGGGQASNSTSFLSGAGGSGIIIVRYPV